MHISQLPSCPACTLRWASGVHLEDVDELTVAGLCGLHCLLAGSQRCLAALHGAGLPPHGGLLGQVHCLQHNKRRQLLSSACHQISDPAPQMHLMLAFVFGSLLSLDKSHGLFCHCTWQACLLFLSCRSTPFSCLSTRCERHIRTEISTSGLQGPSDGAAAAVQSSHLLGGAGGLNKVVQHVVLAAVGVRLRHALQGGPRGLGAAVC